MVASTSQLDLGAGEGEIESLIRTIDWSQTPLGPVVSWPQSLKIAVRIVLGSRYPMFLWWGEELTLLYNMAYAQMTLATKHPWAFGRPAPEVWSEIWSDIQPRVDDVMLRGRATWDEELMLILERNGFPEETYHTFSYSPIPNDEGGIGGLICPVAEETKQVLSQRRLRTLRELAERTTKEAKTVTSICRTAIRTIAENSKDIAFALIYLLDADQTCAKLVGATGLPEGSVARPETVDFTMQDALQDGSGWPLWATLESKHTEVVAHLADRFGALPGNVWPEPSHTALVLPIKQQRLNELAGFLVVGLSPRLALDDEYRGFLELTAGHIGSAIANAQAYEAERQRAEALAELDRSKTTFFNNISHEFRTPLTLMLGPIEESLAEAQAPAERQRLELLHRNSLRLQKLVNTLLDFSRIEAGRLQAFYEPTDLASLTRDLASVFRSAVEKAGLRLLIDCASLSEPIYVDRDKWEQIVLNLISNAFKFTLEGEIEVTLREVRLRAGDAVQLSVRDTGSGIAEDQLPHIFERFHRVEGTRARSLEGTGIGLAFVSELVRLHEGSVAVESVLGQGSTFTVTLPKGMAHLPPAQVSNQDVPASLTMQSGQASHYVEEALRWLPSDDDAINALPLNEGDIASETVKNEAGARVVLADDNADMRDYVRRLLVGKYVVEAVADGAVALESIRRNPPDLLLADVMMPGLDGFGLLQAIRTDEKLKTLPVILLSARAGEEAKVEGFDAGADDYLVKPFSARELLARVGAQLELARVRREAMVALRASEARYRALAYATTNVIYSVSVDGSLLTEATSGRTSRYPQSVVPTLTWIEEYVHPDDKAMVHHSWRTAMATQTLFEMENRLRRADGAWAWVHTRVVPVYNDVGDVVEWIGSATDITARKQAETALRESEERLRLAIQAGDIFTWAVDLTTNKVTYSANVKEVMGFALSEYTEGDLLLVHPDDIARSVDAYQRALRGESNYNIEYRFISPENGESVWVRVQGLLMADPQGNRSRILGITQNITERKHAEEALVALHAQLEAELASVQRLHEVSMALQFEDDIDKLLESILDAAIEITGADKGNIQLLNSATGELHFRSQRGFESHFLEFFQRINSKSNTASANTLRSGSRTVVTDIQKSKIYSDHSLAMIEEADVRAAQSTPLITRGGKLLGVLSTHWRQPHEMNEREARMLDLLARAAVDLIERSQSAEALRQQAEEFKAHFNLTAVGNVQADAQSGRLLLVNKAMCEITGYSEAELLERTAWEITDPQDVAENKRLFEALARNEIAAYEIEKRFLRKDGDVRWAVVSVTVAQRDGNDLPVRTGAVVLDITSRKQAEMELQKLNETLERRVEERTLQVRESEARFRALIDASAQIVWTMDSTGRVVEDSPSWRDFTGQSFTDGKGWGWMNAVHPHDRERTVHNWRHSVANSVPMDTEFRIHHRNGEWYWMQVRAVPLCDETGAVRGWVGMNIDIHERKQAEADRERLARSLIMAEQEERRRISQVLHDDLQQLLYATQMRMAMIGQDLTAAGQMSLLEELEEARTWLRQCVDTTRQMTVDLSPPILKNEGLADALEWLQPQMERRHGLKMVIKAEDNFRIANEDLRALLFQIVRELLFNVSKHAGVDRVVVELGHERDHLVIHVIDEGSGFDMKEVAERKTQKGGFGLFSVHERLRLVGGRMDVQSQPGRGTHVVIHAPVKTERLA